MSATHLLIIPQASYYAMVFTGGLNRLQVDKVNTEHYSSSSRQTQFVASKLITACSAHVQYFYMGFQIINNMDHAHFGHTPPITN